MALVIDASIALKWFLADEMISSADHLLERVRNEGAIVPALFRWEAQSMLTRAHLDSRLTRDLMELALEQLSALPIAVDNPGEKLFFGGEADLALRYDITPYDAAYLAVALDYRVDLATADNDLSRAARDAGVQVIHI